MSIRILPPPSQRWLTHWLIGLFLVTPAATAVACQLCYEAARQMLTDGLQLDMADRAVLAVPGTLSDQYRIVAVVKGNDVIGDIVADSVTGIDVPEEGGDPHLIVRAGGAQQWTSLGTIPVEYADWLRALAATYVIDGERRRAAWPRSMQPSPVLSDAGWRRRIVLVLPHLEDPTPLAARIAWGEVSRAPYEALDVARSRIDPATVAGWLEDPTLAARRASCTLLLGFVGRPEDADRLEQRLEAAWTTHDVTDLAAMIGADLELHGPTRVDWVESKYFADRQRTMPEIEAALLALHVHGEANRTVPRARVIQAYRVFIKERPPMAGFVAQQLADWDYWDAATEYAALLASDAVKDPASHFAVVNYLQHAAAAKAALR